MHPAADHPDRPQTPHPDYSARFALRFASLLSTLANPDPIRSIESGLSAAAAGCASLRSAHTADRLHNRPFFM